MIEVPTVFVLGAGASKPYGFPSGRELVQLVLAKLERAYDYEGTRRPRDFGVLLNCAGFQIQEVKDFWDSLRFARPLSIDRFLEYRPEFRPLGKFLIAAMLVPYQQDGDHLYPKGDWIPTLLDHFPIDEPAPGLLSVVTFNYDTSFERIVRTALENSYPAGDPRRAKVVSEIRIVHVHGGLGDVWMRTAREKPPDVIPDDVQRVQSAAEGIQIVGEVDDESSVPPEFEEAKALLKRAEIVCFLGFGYLSANLERIGFSPSRRLSSSTHYYCCTTGMRTAEINRAKRNLGRPPDGQDHLAANLGDNPAITAGEPGYDALAFLREYPVLR